MRLQHVLDSELLAAPLDQTAAALEVLGLEYDSRKVVPGCLFFAFAGAKVDGRRFAMQAIEKGAVAVVSELAANAVEAAPGAPFRVSIRIIGADVEIALTSRGRVDQLPPRPWEAPSASTPRGRGLAIVASLARRVGLDGGGDTLTITATLDTADT